MIDYEILRADAVTNQIQVKYTKEGNPPYFSLIGMDENFTEEDAHTAAKNLDTLEAVTWHWSRLKNEIEITEPTGQAKTLNVTHAGDYDIFTQYAEKVVTETDTEINVTWEVKDKSVSQLAQQVRIRRNELLQMTDSWGYSDREMTPEMVQYRKALRDVPSQEGFPTSIVWPVHPID